MNDQQNKTKKVSRSVLWGVYGVLLGLCIVVFLLVMSGWRFRAWHFLAPEKITVALPIANTSLFVDGSDVTPAEGYGTTTTLSLPVGTHTIIAAKTGYWPWTKEVTLGTNTPVTLAPFLVLQNTSGVIINEKDPEYGDLLQAFWQRGIPTVYSKKVSPDGLVRVWATGGSIYSEPVATSTGEAASVVETTTDIRSLDFYKGRSDVLIFATDTGVYAIEAQKTSSQNFQPIYKGTAPDFRIKNDSNLYIIDGTQHMIVAL